MDSVLLNGMVGLCNSTSRIGKSGNGRNEVRVAIILAVCVAGKVAQRSRWHNGQKERASDLESSFNQFASWIRACTNGLFSSEHVNKYGE